MIRPWILVKPHILKLKVSCLISNVSRPNDRLHHCLNTSALHCIDTARIHIVYAAKSSGKPFKFASAPGLNEFRNSPWQQITHNNNNTSGPKYTSKIKSLLVKHIPQWTAQRRSHFWQLDTKDRCWIKKEIFLNPANWYFDLKLYFKVKD